MAQLLTMKKGNASISTLPSSWAYCDESAEGPLLNRASLQTSCSFKGDRNANDYFLLNLPGARRALRIFLSGGERAR